MGWNRNNGAEIKPSSIRQLSKKNARPKYLHGIIAGLIVVVVAVTALCLMSKQENAKQEIVPKAPKTEKGNKGAKRIPVQQNQAHNSDNRAEQMAKLKAMTPQERLDFLYEEAKKKPLDLTPSTNRVFKTGVEQVMSWIFTTKLGDPPPPLPQMSIFDEVHLAEIIIADNPVLGTDSEKVKECKEVVALAKKELIAYIKEGGNVEDFLAYYRDQLMEAYHDFASAKRKIFQAYIDGEDQEVCRVYAEQVNAELAQKGIRQVIVPQALIDKFSKPK